MAEFEVGDVVRLKSGGQLMTVSGRDINLVQCMWHSADGVLQDDFWFGPKVLEHSIDDDEGFYDDHEIIDDNDNADDDMTDAELDALVARSGYYQDRGH
jgi:uncharacterized protein YodC (DUF2158 family)